MIKYALLLIFGIILGVISKNEFLYKIKKYLLPFSILSLLFFMGVGIGKDNLLKEKILNFGFSAFIISSSTIIFSVFFAYIFVRLMKK